MDVLLSVSLSYLTGSVIVFIGEIIPIRLFLKGFNFTPTYDNVNGKFSVKYFVNLVLVDEDERRYFKQQ